MRPGRKLGHCPKSRRQAQRLLSCQRGLRTGILQSSSRHSRRVRETLKLIRYRDRDGQEKIGTSLDSEHIVELRKAAEAGEPLVEFLQSPDREKKVQGALQSSEGTKKKAVRLDQVTVLSPIRRPGKIICMGKNFIDHLAEGSTPQPPAEFPISFLKAPSALTGHMAPIYYPSRTKLLDYEVELSTVIGQRCKDVSKDDALNYVAGFSVFNDISARDIQFAEMKRGFCNMGKNFATFAPMGPYLVTPDQAGNPDDLKMELRVNGQTRQSASTKLMVFKIRELIEFFSGMTLEPGDIITSGTPSGVAIYRKPDKEPYLLRPGDVIESQIETLGKLQNTIVGDKTGTRIS